MALPLLDYAPVQITLVLQQGDDWEETFKFRNKSDPVDEYWDLTGWTGHSQIRDAFADTDDTVEPLAELTCTPSADGMTVLLTGAQSELLPKRCKWELQLTSPAGRRRTWLKATVTVEREVTR